MKKLLTLFLILFGFKTVMAQEVPPPNGLPPIAAYSIWYENFKSDQFELALPYGRWLILHSPKTLKGNKKYKGDKQFERMITVYEELAKKQDDPTLKSTYLDSAVFVYDLALKTFSEEEIDHNEWTLNKGRFYQKNSDYFTNGNAKAFEIYEGIVKDQPKAMSELSNGYYVQVVLSNMLQEERKDDILEMIDVVEPFAGPELMEFIDKVRNQVFDSPEERIEFLNTQLEADPENVEMLEELYTLYKRNEFFDEANELANKLYSIDPSVKNTFIVAKNALDNANYKAAVTYYTELSSKVESVEDKKDVAINLTDAYIALENLPKARQYARQASKLDSKWGQPYIRIAKIYAQAVSNCSSGEISREDKAVYWLVLDYLDKAKAVDSSTTNQVNGLYRSYSAVTPTTEDKFFKGWKKGQKITINKAFKDCYGWIGETTSIR